MTIDYIAQLKGLRQRIDALDDALIGLLKQRIAIIHEVGALKRDHTPADCHIRPGREGEMHRRIHTAFAGSDFPPSAALAIWRQIIGSSTHLESPITIAVAGDDTLAWQAREYFGRGVTCVHTPSIREALDAVTNKRATIALLPSPTDDSLVDWTALISHADLRVFAALPVALAPSEAPACYAVAAVAAESSGDDVSLMLFAAGTAPEHAIILATNAHHQLALVAGMQGGEQCLGTLPTPVIDTSLKPW